MIKLLILDEQNIYKTGLMAFFQDEKDITIIKTEGNAHQELEKLLIHASSILIEKISLFKPDICYVKY